ncbi:tetratricopeptide repeat protein [Planctomicrobium sp.]|nr:tetratricopeptide repeat protein [Planctomicrobium sp.]MDA7527803.1 tetratricopeptide repeat protein [bacterium]MDB4743645.1 tetratricopeptide repeat protein [Planctomicrobium sp.]MDB4802699.1 tetratricopeptide repeat protein [bacterium]
MTFKAPKSTILKWSFYSVFAVLVGCSQPPPDIPTADLSEAFPEVAKFIDGKADEVSQDPRSAKAWGAYAMSLDAHEYRDIAIAAYQEAHRLAPHELKWSYLLSQQLRATAPREALQVLQSTPLELHDALVTYRIGELAEETGQLELAISSYRDVLKLTPQHPLATSRLATVLFRRGDATAALQQLDSLQQAYRESTKLRAQILLSQGKVSEAKTLDAAAISNSKFLPALQDPLLKSLFKYRRDPLYQAMQAVESINQGRAWAITTLEKLVEKHPELVQVRLIYAEALLQQNDFEAAENVIATGLEKSPNNAMLLALWGSSEIAQSQWKQAEQHFRAAITVKPDYVGAHADLGYVFEQQQQYSAAIEEYEWVLKMKPADEQIARRLDRLRHHTK